MSAPLPTCWAGWASGAAATNIAEPTAQQVSEGWNVAQAPPSSYENYLQFNNYAWRSFLADNTIGPGFAVKDDFTGDAIDRGKWIVTGSGITTAHGLSALGWGMARFVGSTGDQTQQINTPVSPIGTGPFRVEARVAFPSGVSGGDFWIGAESAIGPSGAALALLAVSPSLYSGRWGLMYGHYTGWSTGFSAATVDMGISPTTTIQALILERNGTALRACVGPTAGASMITVQMPQALYGGAAVAIVDYDAVAPSHAPRMELDMLSFWAGTRR